MGRLIDSDKVSTKIYLTGDCTNQIEEAIDNTETTFDLDMVLDQIDNYGKYRGVIFFSRDKDNSGDNYIPVSVAKQIIRGRGLGGTLGYLGNVNGTL